MPDKSHDADLLRHRTPPGLKRTGTIALCVAGVIVVVGIAIRHNHDRTTAQWTQDQTIPSVQILKLKGAGAGGDLTLPGDVQAFTNAPIFAQVSGTVQKWYFDIGARVKAGALLAQIDPGTYQAVLDQAKGQMARDTATLANARVDLGRDQALAAQNAISNQQLATQKTTVDADAAVVGADQAAVATASINLGYTSIRAPFEGVVTSRAVDVGTLVVVGNRFRDAPVHRRRPDQAAHLCPCAPDLFRGADARFDRRLSPSRNIPARPFTATLVAASGAMSSQNGTQLVQFAIDNRDGVLKPGDYAEVHLQMPAGKGTIRLPATALLFRDSGMMVAIVDPTNHVRLKPIHIGADLGNAVDADTGLSPDRPSDRQSFRFHS